MGLLSDPKKQQKIIDAIAKYNNKLCAVCYVAGVVWFVALAYTPLNANTYFSENALLPGLVDNEFRYEAVHKSYLDELRSELKKDTRSVPREWIYNKFRELGLDTFYHNYTIQYPLRILRGQSISGQNVHAVLRARRASSTESIIMSAPLRAKDSDLPSTAGGIALMLSLAQYFRTQTYWAKDIIFLVTDHEQIGIQAWLDGYHQIESDYIISGDLHGRAGSIQAALNLEIPSESNIYYDVKIEGLNGQLPNLDLVNLVVRLCHVEKATVTLHHRRDSYDYDTFDGYVYSLQTMLKMMWSQASGLPTGNHGLFHRYHIEAVTLEGIRKKKGQNNYRTYGIETSGRIVEGVFRSLNNLLERFHQSFFFYILPGTTRYISIGLYMPPFGLICAAGLIKAIALWISYSNSKTTKATDSNEKSSNENIEKTIEEFVKDEEQKADESSDEEEDEDKIDEHSRAGLVSILPPVLTSLLMGLLAFVGPAQLAELSAPFKMRIEDGITVGIMALFAASLFFPKMVNKQSTNEAKIPFNWQLLKCTTLIFQSLVLFSVSLMNISLAVFLAVGLVPAAMLVRPTKGSLHSLLQNIVLLLVSPASMIFLTSVIITLDEHNNGMVDLLSKSWGTMKQGLLLTVIDRYLFGSWLFALFSFALLPNWLLLWSIAHSSS